MDKNTTWLKRLKTKWGINSNTQIALILIVFAINGSFAAWVAKPITHFLDISLENTNAWIYYPLRILIVFPLYQITLPIVGFCFGQFKFFWNFEKKMFAKVWKKNKN